MPPGVLLFLGYGFLVLAALGLTMPLVVDQAVSAPISFIGVVWMALLAYLIFTMTLVLQRKQAAFGLSLGLTSLLLQLAAIALFAPGGFVVSIMAIALFVILLLALRRPRSREWFAEP
jgi:tryptophan-rich sensory protein